MLRAALLVVLLLVTLASVTGRRGGGRKNRLKGDMKAVQERVMELGKEVKEIRENQAKALVKIQELTSQVEDLREEQENSNRNQLADSDVSGSSEVTYTILGTSVCPMNSYTKTHYEGHVGADECAVCIAKGFSTQQISNKQECPEGWTKAYESSRPSDDKKDGSPTDDDTCVKNTYQSVNRRKKRFSFGSSFSGLHNLVRGFGSHIQKKISSLFSNKHITSTTPAPKPPTNTNVYLVCLK